MSVQGDPFRTLGISPGASVNEIKSAYRRLAKQLHPDTAGERALPRFLAIKAAYEALVDEQGSLRTAPEPPRGRVWSADPDRARATRDAYRARRRGSGAGPTGPAAGTEAGASGRAPADGPARGRRGDNGSTDGSSSGRNRTQSRPERQPPRPEERPDAASSGPDPGREPRHRRGPRKATPGSTTYDEAHDAGFEPEWGGAEWYGPSLGTYWTINPREYADPRKHGPEYQARARRSTGEQGTVDRDAEAAAAPAGATGADDEIGAGVGEESPPPLGTEPAGTPRWRWSGGEGRPPQGRTDPDITDWAAAGWSFRARTEGEPTARTRRESGRAMGDHGGSNLEALVSEAAADRLLARARGSLAGRGVVAFLAWPPIGYIVATGIDLITGCAGLAATCTELASLLPLAVQPAILLVLVSLPLVAAHAAFASLVALGVIVPTTFVLSASGVDEGDTAARAVLAFVAPVAYLVGWAVAVARLARRSPA